jgi:hypothetical protein
MEKQATPQIPFESQYVAASAPWKSAPSLSLAWFPNIGGRAVFCRLIGWGDQKKPLNAVTGHFPRKEGVTTTLRAITPDKLPHLHVLR